MSQKKENKRIDNSFEEEKEPKQPLASRFSLAFLKDERTTKVIGLFLLVFSFFLFLSFVSFVVSSTSFETDQDMISGGDWGWFKINKPDAIENIMGVAGAFCAHLFMHKWFGIASFAILLNLFVWGLKLMIGYELIPLRKLYTHSFFILVWVSLLMGFLFQKRLLFMGGGFGYYGFQWIKGIIGSIGGVLFLLFYALTYSVFTFNLQFSFLKKPEKLAENAEGETATAIENESVEDVTNTADDNKEEEILNEEIPEIQTISLQEENTEEESTVLPIDILPAATEDETAFTPEPLQTEQPKESVPFSFEVTDSRPDEDIIADGEDIASNTEHYGIDTEYDPTLDLRDFQMPTLDLLSEYEVKKSEVDRDELETSKNLIVNTLKNYNIAISEIRANIGPTVTLYEIVPAPGVKISKIKNLEDDIALSLAALGIRIIAPIPGRGTIGIEVPNKKPEMVSMRSVVASRKFQECPFELPVILGKTISNEIFIADMAKMPHLLIAGATGQGKSVGLNALLVSLLYKKHPAYLKFVLVDPKKVELSIYARIERHYLAKLPGDGEAIITENTKVVSTLNSLCKEMDDRYELLKGVARNIIEYNEKFKNRRLNPNEGHRFLPYIVVVIDEVADLIMTAGREVETPIARLAQLARAVGIHVVLATQRPSVNIITGTIKANFPARIAYRVTSKIDSRTILDSNGAEQLIGKGDLLYSTGNDLLRLQCPFVDTPEVERITDFIGNQRGYSSALILPEVAEKSEHNAEDFDPNERDALFEDAARIVVMTQQGSTSLIQRKLKIGYNRAGRLIDQLEMFGVVGAFEGSKARQVLIPDEVSLEQFLKNLDNKI